MPRLARLDDRLPLLLGRAASPGPAPTCARGAAGLAALSPYATLERGYAIVRDPDGRVVRDAAVAVAPATPSTVTLARGALDVRVEGVRDSAP